MDHHVVTEAAPRAPRSIGWEQLSDIHAPDFFQNWLNLQCHLVDSCQSAVLVYRQTPEARFEPVAVWPDAQFDTAPLAELVDQATAQNAGLVTLLKPAMSSSFSTYGIAYPLSHDQQVFAVVTLTVAVEDKSTIKQIMRQIQWGSSWVELAHSRAQEDKQSRLSHSIDLLAHILAEGDFESAAMRLVNELSLFYECDLVSLGFIKNKHIKVTHLSNSTQFGKKMNLIRRIEGAMSESVDQGSPITIPQNSDGEVGIVCLAHQNLAEQQQHKSLMSLPLYLGDDCVGAVTLQRDIEKPFLTHDTRYCESMMALAIETLEEKRINSRSLFIKILDSTKEQLGRLFGPSYLGRKLVLLLMTATVLFFSLATGEYRLSANATVKPLMQRFIVAPFDGFIQDAPVRAGDSVVAGDLIVSLDDGDLQLERLKWLSQQTKLERQYREEAASRNRASVNIIDAQLAQAKTQLQLAESQLQRSRQLAPFNGLIVSGDLSQKLGGAIAQGDILFEISPIDAYRVELKVRESRIADIQVGQTGTLYLSALPEQGFAFKVNKLTPVTVSEDGATFFTVEAELVDQSNKLQPGMEGVGKVLIDERKLWNIWTREIAEVIRLWWWSWWG